MTSVIERKEEPSVLFKVAASLSRSFFSALRGATVLLTYPEGFPRLLYKSYGAPVLSIKAHLRSRFFFSLRFSF